MLSLYAFMLTLWLVTGGANLKRIVGKLATNTHPHPPPKPKPNRKYLPKMPLRWVRGPRRTAASLQEIFRIQANTKTPIYHTHTQPNGSHSDANIATITFHSIIFTYVYDCGIVVVCNMFMSLLYRIFDSIAFTHFRICICVCHSHRYLFTIYEHVWWRRDAPDIRSTRRKRAQTEVIWIYGDVSFVLSGDTEEEAFCNWQVNRISMWRFC